VARREGRHGAGRHRRPRRRCRGKPRRRARVHGGTAARSAAGRSRIRRQAALRPRGPSRLEHGRRRSEGSARDGGDRRLTA
jgi:hypothetical protein